MISALLFDIDGTLFDTNEANVAAYRATFKQLGLHFSASKYRQAFGLRFPEMMKQLSPDADAQTLARVKATKANYYKDHMHLVRPNSGLLALATSAKQYRRALVTTGSHKNIMLLLQHFKVDLRQFEFVITGEDVKHGKPNPECYQIAIKRFKVKPSECLVFEDSDHGVQAAQAAGTQVVRVML